MNTVSGFVRKIERRSADTHAVEIVGKNRNETLLMSDTFAQLIEGRIDPATQVKFTYDDKREVSEISIRYNRGAGQKVENGMSRPLLKPGSRE